MGGSWESLEEPSDPASLTSSTGETEEPSRLPESELSAQQACQEIPETTLSVRRVLCFPTMSLPQTLFSGSRSLSGCRLGDNQPHHMWRIALKGSSVGLWSVMLSVVGGQLGVL